MKKVNVLYGLVCLVCLSCSNVKETPKGFRYTVLRAGDGEIARPGQYLVMRLVFKDARDSVWSDSPMIVMVQDTSMIKHENGIDEIFRMLSKGDSVMFTIDAKTLFEKSFRQAVPKTIDPKSEFTFNMGVSDVANREQVDKLNAKAEAEQNERNSKTQHEQVRKDIAVIDEYLNAHHIAAQYDSSGIRYVITKAGNGPKPLASDTVVVNYVGKLLSNNQVFDQSAAPVTFSLANLIKGWQIGFPLLNAGSKATLYIPSSLAYGPRGYPPTIPENANLIFEVELVKIKK